MIDRRALLGRLGMAAAVVPSARAPAAHAAEYPDRPIRLIVPFAPGGASDLAARIMQPHFSDAFGQSVVVENRAGAAGNIGMRACKIVGG